MSTKASAEIKARLRKLIKQRRADGILVTGMPNVRYFSGFSGTDATLFVGLRRSWLFTDSRYVTQAGAQSPGFRVIKYTKKVEQISAHLKQAGVSRLLFEDSRMPVDVFGQYKKELKRVKLLALKKELDSLRMVKLGYELSDMRKAVKIAGRAFEKALLDVGPGMTELAFASSLEYEMRSAGSGPIPFESIVASGKRGSLPHGTASGKVLRKGELVTVDFGSVYNGYNSDQTITFCLGKPTVRQSEVYEVVREAQARAIAAIRPGMKYRDVDAVARKHISDAGYGKYFGHGLGHGVGLEVHEQPSLGPRSQGRLEEGTVVTVEPGIYIPGWGGVRIEDMIVVGKSGSRILTSSSGPLRVV